MSAMYDSPLEVVVWGDFACFTRPDMKVERVTYPVMTPSAARGVLEAIFWKPEFYYRVSEIWVINPIHYVSLLRNEVNTRASDRAAQRWAKEGQGGYFAPSDRSQRHTLALRNVKYLIRAQIVLKPHATDDAAKYRDQFRRRVQGGRCFTRPYFGCREFAADFAEPDGTEQPHPLSESLGLMLHDLHYATDGSGRGTPTFFRAELQNGVLQVPTLPPPPEG